MEDILIDTNIVIQYFRTRNKSETLLIELLKFHNIFVSPITEFELHLGEKSPRHKKDIEMVFNEVEFLPFENGCGEISSEIWKELKINHQHGEIRDIFMASIAIHSNIWLCTFNKKHFQQISRLKIWQEDKS
jgi:predicted nucleic acid-binding protein